MGQALVLGVSLLAASTATATSRHVASTGTDAGNDCTSEASPCKSIQHGISVMAGGDTLLIGDGTYTDAIANLPSGSAGAYTIVRAVNDWGVVIDGSGFPDTYKSGIDVRSGSYIQVRGVHVRMSQSKETNTPIGVSSSHHVKIQRCSGSYGPTTGNAATIGIGPDSSYVLVEESYAFGGARYQFLVYQSDHVIVRRSVARNDHWEGSLQCAGFVNYDSVATAWQNDIVLDSDTAHCTGKLYGGFWNENKTDAAPDTSQTLAGNIILNVQAFYAADLDWGISGTRKIEDMVIWGSSGGYYGDQGPGTTASVTARRMTIGAISGEYNGPNTGAAFGTGFSIYGPLQNTLTSSLLTGCNSFGVADYTSSNHNAFSNNGANYGGQKKPSPGASDRSSENANAIDTAAGLRYLPRIEAGSALKTAGENGGQIGAEIVFKIGRTGSLHDEPEWDAVTPELLWPFPNEDVIGKDMASYSGPGAPGARGFAAGTSKDGSPQTLTKYIWEYIGNPIPDDVYGLRFTIAALPPARLGVRYISPLTVAGGTPPYAWSIRGALPPGLALDASTGEISGTPTAAGDATFTASATDAAKATTNKELTLRVESDAGDAGDAAPGAAEDSGCGCRAGAPAKTAGLPLATFLLFVLLRRRHRSS